jgi:hypothetical protein
VSLQLLALTVTMLLAYCIRCQGNVLHGCTSSPLSGALAHCRTWPARLAAPPLTTIIQVHSAGPCLKYLLSRL